MKKTLFLSVISCLISVQLLWGQESVYQRKINITGAMTEDGVRLIWTPRDIEKFDEGMHHGFILKRYIKEQNGVPLPLSEISMTEKVLGGNLEPLPAGDPNWFGEYGKAADQIINYVNPNIDPDKPNLADAYTYQQENIERFQFGMFVSYLDFTVAQQMALGYHDTEIESNTVY